MGILSSNGGGSLTIFAYEDNGAKNVNNGTGWQSLQNATTYTCSYGVGADGRVNLSGADPHCADAPVFYLSGANAGFLLGQNPQAVEGGALEPQTTTTFSNSTLAGDYFFGTLVTASQSQQTEVQQATLASGAGTSVSDSTSTTAQDPDITGNIPYTVNADGTVTEVQSTVPVVQFIIINNKRLVSISNLTSVFPYLMIGQQ